MEGELDLSFLEEVESFAVSIARGAGEILVERFRKPLEVTYKGENKDDPVTTADHLSEEYLKTRIKEKFPGHNILGEESGALFSSDSPFVWVLDPLDGTLNYLNGLPLFGVSVGVLWKLRPVAGAVFVPAGHHPIEGIYHARLSGGAFFNDEKLTVPSEPTRCPLVQFTAKNITGLYLPGKSRQSIEARNLGSIALELGLTASGVFRYALFQRPRIWDIAAGILVVKQAGGFVFYSSSGGKHWDSFDAFPEKSSQHKETPEALRNWSSPVLVGAPGLENLVKDIRLRHQPFHFVHALRQRVSQSKRVPDTGTTEQR